MRALALSLLLMLAAACGRSNDAAESGADTVIDSAGTANSIDVPPDTQGRMDAGVVTDSAPRPATGTAAKDISVTSTSAAVIGDSALRRDSIIGRDSAFGPRYRIDSTGKLVPIRRP